MSTQQASSAGVVAGTATAAGRAQQGRSLQLALRAQMMQDVVRLWPLLDPKRLDATWPGWLQAMIALTNRYHGMSSTAAGIFYQEARQHALDVPAPDALIKIAPLPDESWLSRAYGFSGPGLISDSKAAPTAPLTTTLGTAARIAAEGGRTTVIDTTEADPRAVGFYRVTDGNPCAFCAMLAARGPVYRSAASAGEGNQWHNNCVIGSTVVNGPTTEAAYRRWYEGKLIVIRVADGSELSITPNHPVLTDRGWVDAGLLREGDQVVQRSGADLAQIGVPHEHDVPALIQDVWGAHAVAGSIGVPVAAEDFHGDGVFSKGDVQVVRPNRLLADMIDAAFGQVLTQPIVARTEPAISDSFSRGSSLGCVFEAALFAANSLMGGGRPGTALVSTERGHSDLTGLAAIAWLNTGLFEPATHNRSGYTVGIGDRLLGSSRDVLGYSFGVDSMRGPQRTWGTTGSRYDPPSIESDTERFRVHAELGRALLERLSGGVKLASVVDLRRIDYAGHVFNLQTAEGWYDASSLVVSNCGCTVAPAFSHQHPLDDVAQAAADVYAKSTRGVDGAGKVAAFRKVWNARER